MTSMATTRATLILEMAPAVFLIDSAGAEDRAAWQPLRIVDVKAMDRDDSWAGLG